jgi:hypothetical protein
MSLELIPGIYQIFDKVKALTGKDIQLIEKTDLSTFAAIKIARKRMPSHLLYYKTEHTGVINHLIAHECGHILRTFSVQENERLSPYSNNQIKLKALSSIEPEIQKLSQAIPFQKLVQIINMWYAGVIRQLTSYPSDIRIEQWLYDDYPELRGSQSQSLKKQLEEGLMGLSAKVETLTPRRIMDASNSMNYAFFTFIGTHFNDNNYLRRYERSGYKNTGNKLLLIQKDSEDSYRGDIDTINRWAESLQINDWYAWRNFEDIPDNYLTSFS